MYRRWSEVPHGEGSAVTHRKKNDLIYKDAIRLCCLVSDVIYPPTHPIRHYPSPIPNPHPQRVKRCLPRRKIPVRFRTSRRGGGGGGGGYFLGGGGSVCFLLLLVFVCLVFLVFLGGRGRGNQFYSGFIFTLITELKNLNTVHTWK